MKKNQKSKSRSTRMLCPYCGNTFDNRGYDNHVTKCKIVQSKLRGKREDLKNKEIRESHAKNGELIITPFYLNIRGMT